MKHGLHIAAVMMAATAALTSCSDSYPGLEYTNGDGIDLFNSEAYDNVPIMVFVNEQNHFAVTATRGGHGPFDINYGAEYWKNYYTNAPVFVYAFRKDVSGQGTLGPTDMTKGRWGATENTDEYWGRDCLLDGEGHHGMLMKFTKDQPGYLEMQMKEDEKPNEHVKYYSKKYQEEPYNFFAYYLDREKDELNGLSPNLGNGGKVSYTLDIDGSQDIMCGYAPFYTLEQFRTLPNLKTISEKEVNKILNIGGFSTYAAGYGVNPTVDLKHQLVRLDFRAYPGDEGADLITIKSIEVECNTRCELIVASQNLDEVGVVDASWTMPGSLALKERSVDGKDEETELQPIKLSEAEQDGHKWWSFATWDKLPATDKTDGYYRIGSCLMVPQADEYTVKLKFNQPRLKIDEETKETEYEGIGDPAYDVTVTYTVKLQDGSTFEKGKKYPITIAVYGFQEINVSANIELWKDGGDVELDDPGDNMVWGE